MGQAQNRGRGLPSTADSGSTVDDDRLAKQLSDFARRVEAQADPDIVLGEIVHTALALIPGAEEGSISVVRSRRDISSRHPSGTLPAQVDEAQMEAGEGPCLTAAYENQTVRVTDMGREDRWPRFAPRALELGAASMLSFQLYVENDNLGALNLYSRTAGIFTDESEHVGLLLASHASIAFADAQKVHHLTVAVDRRDLIGQAKGILMERHRIKDDEAFRLLVKVSQDHNRKLHEVAEELTRTGHLEQ